MIVPVVEIMTPSISGIGTTTHTIIPIYPLTTCDDDVTLNFQDKSKTSEHKHTHYDCSRTAH